MNFFQFDFSGLMTLFKSPSISWRRWSLILSVIPAIYLYVFLSGFLEKRNIFTELKEKFNRQEVTFYSGSNQGFYHTIGEALAHDQNSSIDVFNQPTSGSNENIFNVLSNSESLGLVQEEFIRNKQFLKTRVKMVTPLYLERLHILYRKDHYHKWGNKRALTLSNSTSARALNYLKNSKMGTGPIGSGTREVVSYLLDELADQYEQYSQDSGFVNYEKINFLPFEEGLKLIDSDSIQVLFAMIGAPMKNVSDLLKSNPNIGIAHLTPSLIRRVSESSGNHYRISNFNNKYDGLDDERISTIGSYCYLVSNASLSEVAVAKVLNSLSDTLTKAEIREAIEVDGSRQFQLDELDFLSVYESMHHSDNLDLLKSAGFFFVTFVLSWVAFVNFLLWLISEYKQILYFKKINHVNSQAIFGREVSKEWKRRNEDIRYKINLSIQNDKVPLLEPDSSDIDSMQIVNNTIGAINELFAISNELHRDYSTGGILDKHHRFLTEMVIKSRESLRKKLLQQLNQIMETQFQIAPNILVGYYTNGFLSLDGYQFLRDKQKG